MKPATIKKPKSNNIQKQAFARTLTKIADQLTLIEQQITTINRNE